MIFYFFLLYIRAKWTIQYHSLVKDDCSLPFYSFSIDVCLYLEISVFKRYHLSVLVTKVTCPAFL